MNNQGFNMQIGKNYLSVIKGLAMASVLMTTTIAEAQTKLAVGTTASSSNQYGYYVAVAQALKEAGIDMQVVETGASLDNLRRLARNQIDLGLVTTNIASLSAQRDPSIPSPQHLETRMLWVYAELPQNVIVRADSGITSLSDLNGKKFNPGIRGSATESTAERVLETLNIKPDYVRGTTGDMVDAIKDNRIVGYVKGGVGNKVDGSTLDLASFTPIRVLGLSDKQKQIIKTKIKDVGVMDIPAGAAEGVSPYSAWSIGYATVVRPDFDEETAYKIAKAVFEDTSYQAGVMPLIKEYDMRQLTIDASTIPLHPGVIRYLVEKGYKIPQHLRP